MQKYFIAFGQEEECENILQRTWEVKCGEWVTLVRKYTILPFDYYYTHSVPSIMEQNLLCLPIRTF
jgi:hypothetical protein